MSFLQMDNLRCVRITNPSGDSLVGNRTRTRWLKVECATSMRHPVGRIPCRSEMSLLHWSSSDKKFHPVALEGSSNKPTYLSPWSTLTSGIWVQFMEWFVGPTIIHDLSEDDQITKLAFKAWESSVVQSRMTLTAYKAFVQNSRDYCCRTVR